MVLYAMTWDLPTDAEKLQVYVNKAKNDWIPATLDHEGAVEISTYRNPMESSPQVLVVVQFADMAAWQRFIASHYNERMMREVRTLGCQNIVTRVWMPSTMTPEPIRADGS